MYDFRFCTNGCLILKKLALVVDRYNFTFVGGKSKKSVQLVFYEDMNIGYRKDGKETNKKFKRSLWKRTGY